MAMWIDVTMSDGTSVYVRASGGYAPDVMHDLQNRAVTLMSHAASIELQVRREKTRQDNEEIQAEEARVGVADDEEDEEAE